MPRTRPRLVKGGGWERFLLATPAMTLYIALVIAPIGLALFYSFTSWNGVSQQVDFVGVENYGRTGSDPEVVTAFVTTLVIAFGTTLILTIISLPLAALLNRSDFVTRLYRSAVFFPIVLASVVVGFIWQTFLNTNGIVNMLLSGIGLDPVLFLGDKALAVASIAFVSGWQTLGFLTVLYIAALQGIPIELYEAASVDGAGPFKSFLHITLPSLAPAIAANSVLLIVLFMRTYDYVVVMTGGGPAGATQTVAFLIVQEAFVRSRFGFATAIAILLVFVVTVIVGIIRTSGRLVGRNL